MSGAVYGERESGHGNIDANDPKQSLFCFPLLTA